MGEVKVERIIVGPLQTNCYLVQSRDEALIIDPGWPDKADYIMGLARSRGVEKVVAIIATHGHFDHVLGVSRMKKLFHADFLIHRADEPLLAKARETASLLTGLPVNASNPAPDGYIGEGDLFRVGDSVFMVYWLPGHSPGSIALIGEGQAFVGDLLFKGSIGRFDLPGSSPTQMKRSLERLLELPPETVVYPGHGPPTRLGDEVRENVVLRMFIEGYL